MLSRIVVVLLVILVLVTGATAYMAYSAFNTVQTYAARFASFERDIGAVKTQAERLRTDTEAVSTRVKRVEDEITRFRR